MAARHKQVGQRTGHERPRAVLGQATVPHLGELEHALDDPEGVFDPSADARLVAIALLLPQRELLAAVRALVHERFGLGRQFMNHVLLPGVARIRIGAANDNSMPNVEIHRRCAALSRSVRWNELLGGAVPLEDASRHRANCSGFDIAGVRSSRGLDE